MRYFPLINSQKQNVKILKLLMINKIHTKITTGSFSTDFKLFDYQKKEWQLHNKIGRILALLFYPGNETLVCTKQLCSVRDNWVKYMDSGAEIVGISSGNEDDNQQFAANHHLPMTLLADTNREITNIYGKHSWMPIWATRAVVIIDSKGFVRYQNIMVRALRPSDDEILSAINLAKYDVLAEQRLKTQIN
jgi:thioredoxin-dependent peroxiredoxin